MVAAFLGLGLVETVSYHLFDTVVTPEDPGALNALEQFEGPSWDHPFGTNQKGQDMLSRIMAGSRISFLIGLLGLTLGFIPGTFLGIVSGYFQRWLDYVIQRGGEAWSAFPILFLYIALILKFGQGLHTITMVVAISALFGGSRVLRAAALVTKHQDFVMASRSLGAREGWVLFKHIIPNVMPIIIVGASAIFAASVLAEAALSFLGLGVDPSTPSWGIDLNDGRDNMRLHPHVALFPGIAISLVVLGFNLLGDTLRDILDPRLRGSLR